MATEKNPFDEIRKFLSKIVLSQNESAELSQMLKSIEANINKYVESQITEGREASQALKQELEEAKKKNKEFEPFEKDRVCFEQRKRDLEEQKKTLSKDQKLLEKQKEEFIDRKYDFFERSQEFTRDSFPLEVHMSLRDFEKSNVNPLKKRNIAYFVVGLTFSLVMVVSLVIHFNCIKCESQRENKFESREIVATPNGKYSVNNCISLNDTLNGATIKIIHENDFTTEKENSGCLAWMSGNNGFSIIAYFFYYLFICVTISVSFYFSNKYGRRYAQAKARIDGIALSLSFLIRGHTQVTIDDIISDLNLLSAELVGD